MGRSGLLVLVGVGGAAGALVRWGIHEAWTTGAFPWATLLVNILGCALLGVITAGAFSPSAKRLAGTGFAGGLTTFSTFTVEIVELLDAGRAGLAVLYLVVSLITGVAAFVLARSAAGGPAIEAPA